MGLSYTFFVCRRSSVGRAGDSLIFGRGFESSAGTILPTRLSAFLWLDLFHLANFNL